MTIIAKYRPSFFLYTQIENLPVVKGLVTYGLGADKSLPRGNERRTGPPKKVFFFFLSLDSKVLKEA